MVKETKESKQQPLAISAGVWVVLALVLLGTAGFWYLQSASQRQPSMLELTPEAKEYVRSLKLADVGIKATESYLKQMVVEIDGKITNVGTRPLNVVEVYCVFHDAYGQVVLRERVPIVGSRLGGLKPQETKPFRLPFENIPESWNRATPQIVIAGIRFAG